MVRLFRGDERRPISRDLFPYVVTVKKLFRTLKEMSVPPHIYLWVTQSLVDELPSGRPRCLRTIEVIVRLDLPAPKSIIRRKFIEIPIHDTEIVQGRNWEEREDIV